MPGPNFNSVERCILNAGFIVRRESIEGVYILISGEVSALLKAGEAANSPRD